MVGRLRKKVEPDPKRRALSTPSRAKATASARRCRLAGRPPKLPPLRQPPRQGTRLSGRQLRSRGRGARYGRFLAAAALVVALFVVGAYGWRSGLKSLFMGTMAEHKLAAATRLSIVVLPFENMSGDKEQDYFADGITDDLTTDLSHLQDSFVISRGTAFTYKGKPVDAKEIGRELGVRYVLEGSVRRLGETITVNAQLISTETGSHVWADRFEGERSKLGQLQVNIVARLANSLGAELIRAEALRATRERPNNPDAVDLAMRGGAMRLGVDFGSKANQDAAIALFERALAIDPELVPAMVGLARTLVDRVTTLYSDDPKGDITGRGLGRARRRRGARQFGGA
jgi:adenylate cyclase